MLWGGFKCLKLWGISSIYFFFEVYFLQNLRKEYIRMHFLSVLMDYGKMQKIEYIFLSSTNEYKYYEIFVKIQIHGNIERHWKEEFVIGE